MDLISLGDAHYSPGPSLQSACVLGKAQCRAPAHLHPLLLPEKEKFTIIQFFFFLCATSCLVRKPFLREGTTRPDEKKLFSQDGCCSQGRQMAQRSEGVSGLLWCVCAGPSPWQCTGLQPAPKSPGCHLGLEWWFYPTDLRL